MNLAGKCAIGCAVLGIGFTAAGAAMGAVEVGKEVLAETIIQQFGDVTMEYSLTASGKDSWDTDWDDYAVSTKEDDHLVYEFEKVKKIEADLSVDQIYFSAYDGNVIRVETDGDSDILRIKQEGDELKLKSLTKTHDCEIYVWYPETLEFEEMELEVGAGAVYLEDKLTAWELDIEVGAGELIADGELITEKANLDVGTGSAIISKMDASKLEAECGVGTIEVLLTGAENEYSYEAECGIGSISVGNEVYEGLSKSVKVDRPDAKKELQLECGLGEVTVLFEK